MWRKSLCLFVCVLFEACEALTTNNCLDRVPHSYYCESGDPELPASELQIECTATEATVTFTYRGSDYYTSIVSYAVTWICESAFGQEVYECSDQPLLSGPNDEFSLNITGRGGWGSSCLMQGCVTYNDVFHHIFSENNCTIGPVNDVRTMATTVVTDTNRTTVTDQITVHVPDEIKIQARNTDTLIMNVLAPLMGVLILLILLVIVVIIPLIFIIYLRMRKFSHNWQAYGNPELPFDPHYTPVDIEKPSFNPTPRLSLLSVDMFQNLYMARTNHGNLYMEPPSIHPNIRYDSCSTLDSTGEESENERVSSVLSEISIPNAGASLDDNDALYKTCTVSESSYQPPNIQYIQHIPLLRNSQSLKDDFQDDLQGNFSSDLDYADSAYGISGGDILHDNVSDSLHFWEQSSVPLPTHSDHFPSLCADLAETNTIQLDKAYTSSESGYIQSHDTNCSSLFIEDATPNLDTSNQGVIITQPAKIPSVEQQSLEAPTTLLDDESMNSMDSSLNFYGIGEHTQMDNSEDEIDIPRLDESDTGKHHHGDGYIEHKQHNILSDHDSGLLPQPFDIDLDFVPVPSEPVRPTSINFRLTASDHAHSDLSSGYITTSCMSHDDGQNVMELLFQQKLKDVKEEFIEF